MQEFVSDLNSILMSGAVGAAAAAVAANVKYLMDESQSGTLHHHEIPGRRARDMDRYGPVFYYATKPTRELLYFIKTWAM